MTAKAKSTAHLSHLFRQLAQLSGARSRRKFLARHPMLRSAEVVKQLDDMVSEHLRVNLREALVLAEAAVEIAQPIRDKEPLAHALRAKANALSFMGENKTAVALHEEAISRFQECGATLEVGRTLSASIQPLILLGEYERAFVASERAREIFKKLGEPVRLARLEINTGNIFFRQNRFIEALACYRRALEGLLPDKDTEGIAASLHNVAVCHISLDNFREALDTYERARAFSQQHEMPLAVVQADYNIAYLYYLRGQFSRAIEMLRATREHCQRAGDAYHLALCDLDLSEIYLELNLSEEAAEAAQAAHAQFRHLQMGYESAKALAHLAISLGQQGKAFRALECFAQARATFVKEKNLAWPSLIDLYQALVLYDEGRLFEARHQALAALEFFRTSTLPSKAILCQLLLARLSIRTGDPDSARRECQNALEGLGHIESPILNHQANLLMGEIEEAANDFETAYGCYQTARQALETLRSSIQGEELKIAFMKNRVEVYENLVNLCLRHPSTLVSPEDAFGYMEEAKSRALRDLIFRREHPAPVSEPGQSDLVRRIRDLREELNWYYHRIEVEQLGQGEHSPEHIMDLQVQAREREKQLLSALRETPASESEDVAPESMPSFKLESIRTALDSNTILLEYFCIRDRLVVALVTRERLEVIPLTVVSRVNNLLRLLHFQLSKFQLDSAYVQTFAEPLLKATQGHLLGLYQELLAPLRHRLDRRHLILVPHDALHYLPFHALFDGSRYVVDTFTISYAPSATIYAMCHQKAANNSVRSLIMGIPDPRAPHILEEVQSVAVVLPEPELILGPNANERALREKGPESRLIHIATHGHFRKDNPMFSGIRLGDSYLSLYDLYSLKLPVEQVTLSGCATGLNVVAKGDELLGLARGLLYAGARSLLLTLWDVHDRSTSEFMKSFYGHLLARPDKSLAIQASMRELRQRYPHPYYWAPFVLVGAFSAR